MRASLLPLRHAVIAGFYGADMNGDSSYNTRFSKRTAIVMGSGGDAAKEAADYITTPQEEDGIWNACVHFGLL